MKDLTRKRMITTKLLLVMAGSLFALTAAELGIRILMPAPTIGFIDTGRFRLSGNPRLLVEPVPFSVPMKDVSREPGTVSVHLNQGFTKAANSLGLRDQERILTKTPGVTRVLVLGDSVTMGFGVNAEEALYPSVAEAQLQKEGYRVEFLNFGISTYNTGQEVEFFVQHGLAFKPDIVVLQYCLNDDEDPFPANRALYQRLLEIENQGGKLSQTRFSVMSRWSHLYRYWELTRVSPRVDEMKIHDTLSREPILDSLKRLRQLSSDHNFKLLVMGAPSQKMDTIPADVAELKALNEMATSLSIPSDNLLPTMLMCAKNSPKLFVDIYHFDAAGHSCVGAHLADTLKQTFTLERAQQS